MQCPRCPASRAPPHPPPPPPSRTPPRVSPGRHTRGSCVGGSRHIGTLHSTNSPTYTAAGRRLLPFAPFPSRWSQPSLSPSSGGGIAIGRSSRVARVHAGRFKPQTPPPGGHCRAGGHRSTAVFSAFTVATTAAEPTCDKEGRVGTYHKGTVPRRCTATPAQAYLTRGAVHKHKPNRPDLAQDSAFKAHPYWHSY